MPWKGDTLYIDNSTLTTVHNCSTRAVLRYYHGYTNLEEAATLKSGSAGHKAIEVYWKGGTVDDAMDAFDAQYKDWAADNVIPGDRLSYENVYGVVRGWCEQHPVKRMPFKIDPKLVEVGIAQELSADPHIVLTGKLDAIVLDSDKLYYPLDHKFSGRVDGWWANQFKLNSQFTGYQWAAAEQLGLKVGGVYLNAIHLGLVPSSDRVCTTHSKGKTKVTFAECGSQHLRHTLIGPSTRTPHQIEAWKREAKILALRFWDLCYDYPELSDLHKLRMEGMFGYETCKGCEFQNWCLSDRPIKNIKNMLRHEPWVPFELGE